MKYRKIILFLFVVGWIICLFIPSNAQQEGLKLIKAENMKFHMKFLSSDEFKGRNTPSSELKIASRYIALMAETIGLKPLMPNGSYYQELPLEISTISESASSISITSQTDKRTFFFPQTFGVRGRSISPGQVSSGIVFLGLGIHGAYYFVTHSPVPIEKISAELNMDMLCRNDPNSIYLIGSNKLSTELDASIHNMNDKYTHLNLDYTYEDPAHPNRFFFRSDQYPYIRYGIPGVWFFSGTTEDYHQGTDTEDRVDYSKLEKVTQLVYLTAIEIGNKNKLLKLDIHEQIKIRGKHNLEYAWRKP